MYAKLFASILDSSVWLEAMPTRIVWLTLLAAKDRDGFARFASVENLARRAVVSVEEAEKAVETLEAPDGRSSNPDHEGRRIERVPGGWLVLNAKLYDAMVKGDDEREATRDRVRRHRERKKSATSAPRQHSSEEVSIPAPHLFTDADQQTAYEALRSAASVPAAFDATLRAIVEPPSGGAAYPWPVVGRALHDLYSANGGKRTTAATIRSFCRRITTDDERPSGKPLNRTEQGQAHLVNYLEKSRNG